MGKKSAPPLPTYPKWGPRAKYLLAPGILANAILAAGLAAIAPGVPRAYPPPICPCEEGIAGTADVVRPQSVAVRVVGAHPAEGGGPPAEPAIRAERRERWLPSVVDRVYPDFGEGDWSSSDEVFRSGSPSCAVPIPIPVAAAAGICSCVFGGRPAASGLRGRILHLIVPAHKGSLVESIDIDGVIIIVPFTIVVRVGVFDVDGLLLVPPAREW